MGDRAADVDGAQIGPVGLTLPPDPTLSRMARLAVSGMASMARFTVDEVEDIKLVVSEIIIALIEHGSGERIELELTVTADGFVVRGSTPSMFFDPDHPDLVLSRMVLDSASAEHGIEAVEGGALMWATVSRSAET